MCIIFVQSEKHRSLNLTRQYVLESLYPNTLYYMWISAKSSKGEGAHTTPIKVTTAQYGKYLSKDMSVSPKAQSQTTSRKKLARVIKVPLRENRIKIYKHPMYEVNVFVYS